jgi:uncharacterized damage-inducible protein DinB
MDILKTLAAHNQWANEKIFVACSGISPAKLSDESYGYDSVIGILNHMIQVENSFFELAHARQPAWTYLEDLNDLRAQCSRIDQAYLEYADGMEPGDADIHSFLVPWFGFEITLSEGVLQPLTHSHKHRSDVSMLLPLLGGAGIDYDLIQWIAEQRDQ